MTRARYTIENLFKQLASAGEEEDPAELALRGDMMNPPTRPVKSDPRGGEWGHYEVVNIPGGKKVTWFAGEFFTEPGAEALHGYTCYVPDEDWDIFQSEHDILDS